MNSSKVLELKMKDGELNIIVQGHPTVALARAYGIMAEIYGDTRWRITEVDYLPPRIADYASAGSMTVSATSRFNPCTAFTLGRA